MRVLITFFHLLLVAGIAFGQAQQTNSNGANIDTAPERAAFRTALELLDNPTFGGTVTGVGFAGSGDGLTLESGFGQEPLIGNLNGRFFDGFGSANHSGYASNANYLFDGVGYTAGQDLFDGTSGNVVQAYNSTYADNANSSGMYNPSFFFSGSDLNADDLVVAGYSLGTRLIGVNVTGNRALSDAFGNIISVDFNNRTLNQPTTGTTILDWSGTTNAVDITGTLGVSGDVRSNGYAGLTGTSAYFPYGADMGALLNMGGWGISNAGNISGTGFTDAVGTGAAYVPYGVTTSIGYGYSTDGSTAAYFPYGADTSGFGYTTAGTAAWFPQGIKSDNIEGLTGGTVTFLYDVTTSIGYGYSTDGNAAAYLPYGADTQTGYGYTTAGTAAWFPQGADIAGDVFMNSNQISEVSYISGVPYGYIDLATSNVKISDGSYTSADFTNRTLHDEAAATVLDWSGTTNTIDITGTLGVSGDTTHNGTNHTINSTNVTMPNQDVTSGASALTRDLSAMERLFSPQVRDISVFSAVSNSGTGGANAISASGGFVLYVGTAAAGYANVDITNIVTANPGFTGGTSSFTVPTWVAISGQMIPPNSDAGRIRITFGAASGVPTAADVAPISGKGYGAEIYYSTANSRVEIRAFSYDSSITYSAGVAFNYDYSELVSLVVGSDAAGNVLIYGSGSTSTHVRPTLLITHTGVPTTGSWGQQYITAACVAPTGTAANPTNMTLSTQKITLLTGSNP